MSAPAGAPHRAPAFVLVHGPKSDAWYWHLVVPRLRAAGREVVAIDLPIEDDRCGLAEYADVVAESVSGEPPPILVTHSMAAFIAPLVAARRPLAQIVLVAPTVPAPGESPRLWWSGTGHEDARREQAVADGRDPDAPFDPDAVYLDGLPPAVASAFPDHVRHQSSRPCGDHLPDTAWPAVATRCVLGARDRLFPLPFQTRLAGTRLGLVGDVLDSGHLVALDRPAELAALLLQHGVGPDRPPEQGRRDRS